LVNNPSFYDGGVTRALRNKWILTEVLAGVSGGRCEMALGKRMHGTSVRRWGLCGGPPTPVSPLAVVARSPHPLQPVG
jgi:hypothetical protein